MRGRTDARGLPSSLASTSPRRSSPTGSSTSRPAPYLVFHCMEATGVQDVRRVLVAGDTPNDLGAGTNAGAGFVVGVATGSFTHDRLATEPHTHLLPSTADLPTLL